MTTERSPGPVLAPADTISDVMQIAALSHELHAPFGPGERSCCCPSTPAVRVVLLATPHRDHAVDLLLCRHHHRNLLPTLARADAQVFDSSGALLRGGLST